MMAKRLLQSIVEVGLSTLENAAAYEFQTGPSHLDWGLLELVALRDLQSCVIDLLWGENRIYLLLLL